MVNRIDLLSLYVCFLNEVSWGFIPFSLHKLWVHNESNITWPTLEKPNVQAKEVYFQDWVCWCMVIDFLRVRFAHTFQCRSCFTHKEKNSLAGFFSSFPWIAGHLRYNGFRTYSLCRRIFIWWYNDTAASRRWVLWNVLMRGDCIRRLAWCRLAWRRLAWRRLATQQLFYLLCLRSPSKVV